MENQILYEKTAKGALQAGRRSRVLPEQLQLLLLAVDGVTSAGELAQTRGAGAQRGVMLGLRRLADMGFIRAVAAPQGQGANPGSAGSLASDLDFTTLAE
jgi:hypothetical protein